MQKQKRKYGDLLYELRYYEQIPYQEHTVRQIEELKEKIEKAERELIHKACKEKILTTCSQQNTINTIILKNLFQSKIINLENTIYVLKYHKGILKIQIYDTNMEEEVKEILITEKIELLVKLNKKIKIWL